LEDIPVAAVLLLVAVEVVSDPIQADSETLVAVAALAAALEDLATFLEAIMTTSHPILGEKVAVEVVENHAVEANAAAHLAALLLDQIRSGEVLLVVKTPSLTTIGVDHPADAAGAEAEVVAAVEAANEAASLKKLETLYGDLVEANQNGPSSPLQASGAATTMTTCLSAMIRSIRRRRRSLDVVEGNKSKTSAIQQEGVSGAAVPTTPRSTPRRLGTTTTLLEDLMT
jgi:hypothetical protein